MSIRRTLLTAASILATIPVQSVHADPLARGAFDDYAVSAKGVVSLGNSAKILDSRNGDSGIFAPVASATSVLVDERAEPGSVHSKDIKSGNLAVIHGSVYATRKIMIGPNNTINGNVDGNGPVTVGSFSDVFGYATSSQNSLKLAKLATVATNALANGDLYLASDSKVGHSAIANGFVTLGKESSVGACSDSHCDGQVLYKTGIKLFDGARFGSTATHAGIVLQGYNLSMEDPGLGQLNVTPGTQDISVGKNEHVVLAPGSYGNLNLAERGNLEFNPGKYTFRSISADMESTLLINTTNSNPVTIVVSGDVNLARRFKATVSGSAHDILTVTKGAFKIGPGGSYVGTLLAKKKVTLGKRADLTGAVYSDDSIAIGRDCTVYWLPY